MAVRHAPRNRLSVQVTAHPDRWSHKQNSAYGLLNSKNGIRLKRRIPFFVLLNAFTHLAPASCHPEVSRCC